MYTFSRNGIEIVTAFPLSVQKFRCTYRHQMVVPLLPKLCNQNLDRRIYPVFDLAEISIYFDPLVTFFTLMFLISLVFLLTRIKLIILFVTVEEKPQLFFGYNLLYITSLLTFLCSGGMILIACCLLTKFLNFWCWVVTEANLKFCWIVSLDLGDRVLMWLLSGLFMPTVLSWNFHFIEYTFKSI